MLAHVAAPRWRRGREHLECREKNSSNQFDVYEDRTGMRAAPRNYRMARDFSLCSSLQFAWSSNLNVSLHVLSLFLSVWGLPSAGSRYHITFAYIVDLAPQKFRCQCSRLLSESSTPLRYCYFIESIDKTLSSGFGLSFTGIARKEMKQYFSSCVQYSV
jgi:hypothetical protein